LFGGKIMKFIDNNNNIRKHFYFSKNQRKYPLIDCINEIYFINKTGIAWRDVRFHIPFQSLYKTFKSLVFHGIFKLCHKDLLLKYIKKAPNRRFKYLLTDTSFIPNKKGKDVLGYSKFYNRKNGIKISLIIDAKGMSLNMECYPGNKHDSKILLHQLKIFDTVWYNHDHNSQDNAIFLADPAYDCEDVRENYLNWILIH
jgi:hypothetical protein